VRQDGVRRRLGEELFQPPSFDVNEAHRVSLTDARVEPQCAAAINSSSESLSLKRQFRALRGDRNPRPRTIGSRLQWPKEWALTVRGPAQVVRTSAATLTSAPLMSWENANIIASLQLLLCSRQVLSRLFKDSRQSCGDVVRSSHHGVAGSNHDLVSSAFSRHHAINTHPARCPPARRLGTVSRPKHLGSHRLLRYLPAQGICKVLPTPRALA
jgi:hypothetical protein